MTQLHWLLIGLAVMVGLLIWWLLARRPGDLSRRRRLGKEPPLFSEAGQTNGELREGRNYSHPAITPEHHLADKYLVDVEISPIDRRSAASTDPTWQVAESTSPPARLEPEWGLVSESEAALAESAALATDAAPSTLTVALTVLAPAGRDFVGTEIQRIAEELELRLGAHGMFERFPSQMGADAVPVFSLAHLRKPGAFDPATLAQLTTPGLLLFMRLPGPLGGSEALDLLVISADHLVRNLGGHLGDARHQRLTNAKLLQLHEQVAEFERRWRAAADEESV